MTHLSPPVRSPRPLEASHDWGGVQEAGSESADLHEVKSGLPGAGFLAPHRFCRGCCWVLVVSVVGSRAGACPPPGPTCKEGARLIESSLGAPSRDLPDCPWVALDRWCPTKGQCFLNGFVCVSYTPWPPGSFWKETRKCHCGAQTSDISTCEGASKSRWGHEK